MRAPISKPIDVKFRGPTSSQEYNESERLKYADIIELFKQSNDSLLTLRESYNVVLAENHFMHVYANQLNQMVQDLSLKLTQLEEGKGNYTKAQRKFAKDMRVTFPNELQTTSEVACNIESEYRFANISSIHAIPKTHLKDVTGAHVIPKGLEVEVKRLHNKGVVTSNDLLHMFDGDETSYWQHVTSYENPSDIPVSGEVLDLEIKLPLNVSNQLKVNSISMNPHPESGVVIENIEIYYNGEWKQIAGFNQAEASIAAAGELIGKRKWIFEETYVEKVRIRLKQKMGLSHNGKTNFYLGAQDLSIAYETFTTSGGYVLTPFNLTGLYDIQGVEHEFTNRKALSYSEFLEEELYNNVYTYQLLWEGPDKILRTLNEDDWKNQTSSKIWIKTNLHIDPNNGVSPCLHSVRLKYTIH